MFEVTVQTSSGALYFVSRTPEEALEKARKVWHAGFREVIISDDEGHTYSPTQFQEHLLQSLPSAR